jgi:hypothetical protein
MTGDQLSPGERHVHAPPERHLMIEMEAGECSHEPQSRSESA